eukprot:TRINITY_DN34639_c0_g1_i1.p1 TRINITY_DN34639_c0_g1~~TRINITY_DN34639_c0_g1_i1.p1  ORF type:complete len:366 (+),score=39.21 TRINITY_DN34639_c0_g1_i1:157-1098(+)
MASLSVKTAAASFFYCGCSASMLFLNKLSVSVDGGRSRDQTLSPGALATIQVFFATIFCLCLQATGYGRVDNLERRKVMWYSLYCFLFVGSVYTSMISLSNSNVETLIVFRAATPLFVSVMDVVFLGRRIPDMMSSACLVVITAGAVSYVLCDSAFALGGVTAYFWSFIYFFVIALSMTLGKYITDKVKMSSVWGSVYYTNLLSLPGFIGLGIVSGDFIGLQSSLASQTGFDWALIVAGCLVGTLIGYAGWLARDMLSATGYTVLGVASKIVTVMLSICFLDKHASLNGVIALLFCIAGAAFYRQSPLRGPSS